MDIIFWSGWIVAAPSLTANAIQYYMYRQLNNRVTVLENTIKQAIGVIEK